MLFCNNCNNKFTEEDGVHEANLAWNAGRQAGDYVCPCCGTDDSAIEEITDYNTPFINDKEKMRDFYELSKEEFLKSYSYLTEEEYDATAAAFIQKMSPVETSAGIVTTESYNDGCAKGIKILLDGNIVCMLDVYEAKDGETEGEARVLVYKKEYDEDEEDAPIACIPINR